MVSIPARLNGLARLSPRALLAEDSFALAVPARTLLACLLASAGVIHLAMVPSHVDEWLVEGVGFAVAGWLQLAAAVALILRPSRALVASAVAVNVALVAIWAVSRTSGIPVGPNAGHAEAATFIDGTTIALELAFIGIASVLLARPDWSARWDGTDRYLVSLGSVAALALATAALASPSARDHAMHAHGGDGSAHAHGGDDKGLSLLSNGHHHEIVQHELHPTTQALLDEQLAVTRDVAALYPTVADAEAAGYKRAGPYFPGIGAHYLKFGQQEFNRDGVVDEADLQHPLAIIYDGTHRDSRIAGFMYYSMSTDEPQGFVGPNDTWHYHENICLRTGANGEIDAPFGIDNAATKEECEGVGGSVITMTQWMLHVWSVPGYDNVNGGTFAEVNPALDCADGTYYTLPPDEWSANPMNVCRVQA
jgi:hypothetical protein